MSFFSAVGGPRNRATGVPRSQPPTMHTALRPIQLTPHPTLRTPHPKPRAPSPESLHPQTSTLVPFQAGGGRGPRNPAVGGPRNEGLGDALLEAARSALSAHLFTAQEVFALRVVHVATKNLRVIYVTTKELAVLYVTNQNLRVIHITTNPHSWSERVFFELMSSDRKLEASREGSKWRIYGKT